MAIKLDSIKDWTLWRAGMALPLAAGGRDHDEERLIKLEVNCALPTAFHVETVDSEVPFFLAVVQGREVIEVWVAGDVLVTAVSVDDRPMGDVWFYTSALDVIWSEGSGETFTTIVQRRARNPELEAMQFIMRENERRRDATLNAALVKLEGAKNENRHAASAGDAGAPEREPVARDPGSEAGEGGEDVEAGQSADDADAGAGDGPVKRAKSAAGSGPAKV